MARPNNIQRCHLERLAVAYGRQSTFDQVENHTGSTDYQRGQMRFPAEWGWPPARIKWLDDFGLSGTAAEHRSDYLELRRLIREGKVGLVCVSDHSRLGRKSAEWLSFLTDCLDHDVLIAIDGKIVDLGDTNDRLHTALMAVLAEHDGLNRRDTFQRGKTAKFMTGNAVSFPPVGYVHDRDRKGKWKLDPAPEIRGAIAAVFREFFRARSLRATVIRLREQGVKLPRRRPGHDVTRVEPSIRGLQGFLSNPNYTPDYYYRRRVDDPKKSRNARGRHRTRKASAEEMKIISDHHDGYVTREQWAEIRAIFQTNAWSPDHANLGDGPALVQGLPRCPQHRNRLMSTYYKRGKDAGARYHSYCCWGDYDLGGSRCRIIPGWRLDDAIAPLVLRRLSPPSIVDIQGAFGRMMADRRAERRHRDIEKARLRQRVLDLEQKLDALDPDSFNVFKTVERNLEQAKRDLTALDEIDDVRQQRALRDDAAVLAEAEKLAGEVSRIWEAPTTTDRDRKALLRTLVRTILIEEWGDDWVRVRVRWMDGGPDIVVDVLLSRGVQRLIVELRDQGRDLGEIAGHLNGLGIKTQKRKPWSSTTVRQFIWRRKRRTGAETAA